MVYPSATYHIVYIALLKYDLYEAELLEDTKKQRGRLQETVLCASTPFDRVLFSSLQLLVWSTART